MICNFYYLINGKTKLFICPRLFYGQLCANYENSSAQFRQAEEIRLKQPQLSGSNLIYQILHGQCHIWDLYVLGLKSNFFCKKPTTKYSKPWTRDSQCQDGCCSFGSYPKCPKKFRPNLSGQAQKFGIFEKKTLSGCS